MHLKRLLTTTVVSLAAVTSAAWAAPLTITGGGSSFDNPAFTRWFDAYKSVNPDVQFNYQPNGSGFGQSALMNGTLDFGASDFTLSDEQMGKSTQGPIVQFPIVAGAVVLSYTLPDAPKLRFDGDVVAEIFLGRITKWNDPKIAALNPGATLPDLDIIPVHRSDTSGTTFIFTDYLSAVNRDWESSIGRSASPKWPGGIGGKGNAGVAGQVKQLPGAIGYVELAYAVQNKLSFATMKNAAAKFVEASPDSVSAALAHATIPDDYRFSMVNAPGEDAYPIAGASWVLIPRHSKDAAKAKAMAAFFTWAVKDGQKLSKELEYAPLPSNLQQRIVKTIGELQ